MIRPAFLGTLPVVLAVAMVGCAPPSETGGSFEADEKGLKVASPTSDVPRDEAVVDEGASGDGGKPLPGSYALQVGDVFIQFQPVLIDGKPVASDDPRLEELLRRKPLTDEEATESARAIADTDAADTQAVTGAQGQVLWQAGDTPPSKWGTAGFPSGVCSYDSTGLPMAVPNTDHYPAAQAVAPNGYDVDLWQYYLIPSLYDPANYDFANSYDLHLQLELHATYSGGTFDLIDQYVGLDVYTANNAVYFGQFPQSVANGGGVPVQGQAWWMCFAYHGILETDPDVFVQQARVTDLEYDNGGIDPGWEEERSVSPYRWTTVNQFDFQ